MKLPLTIKEIEKLSAKSTVTLNGWIRSVRHQKKLSFANVSDGTADIQVLLPPDSHRGYLSLTTGASISVDGTVCQHPRNQSLEIKAESLKLWGECPGENYPMQKKDHGSEHLRDNAHLRVRSRQIASVIRLRDQLSYNFASWFKDFGFMNVQPPIITSSDCEGAGEVFEVRHPTKSEKFFGRDAYLSVSTQLHLEAISSGFSRVYTLSPTFRAEGSQTNRHLAEFWMLEAELSFVEDLETVMQVVENSIKSSVKNLTEHSEGIPSMSVDSDWPRLTYTEAIEILKKRHEDAPFQYIPEWGASLQSEHERYLADTYYGRPLFVTDYPENIKPFYMRVNDDGKTVSCFDLLAPGIGELAGGSLREERLQVLEDKMSTAGLDRETYGWYVDLRRFGSVPHGGFGIGYERLISALSGVSNLRDVVLFPRWAGRCTF
ncbi:putative asparaginyl-tRNA synthetase [Wallemia mellicola]|uniref:Asparagine--tRNA ligase, mitochondrial n=1 Tax=Wallemia mellicola TaxID=1708541 RepID=A0AB38MGY0_9BASI|nr:hypothetical protein E3Q24_00031 [Wallemia mellicola]TIB82963.1 putative asparaginyl-tRNA synthetase [Wallemia mellicola]TIB85585.1 putative asparaginyl-tRNA synthetase [Wallemia mellicola]TIC06603.1 putative asparaginyl-tRNA synthetase [Wallemia mellicola]TIC38416.1 putative asparaginyl-tRNA synthetase [Wallemia mellicola]